MGVTEGLTGSIAFDEEGGIIAERSKIAVDVSSLESDDSRSDRYFTFGYFNMTIPSWAVFVLSVVDNVQLELDFTAAVETGG